MKISILGKVIQGIVVGMGSIAPGFSGSALAVSMGIYDPLIGACNGLICDIKHIKKHIFYLLPFAIGGGLGVLVLSQAIEWMFLAAPVLSTFIFIGLLLGSMPNVIESANKNGFNKKYLLFSLLFFIFAIFLGMAANKVGEGHAQVNPSFMMLFLYGCILGLGTVVPGLSSSFMLMSIGGYETTIGAISGLHMQRLLPIALGSVLIIALCIKFINFLIKKFHGYLYYSMIGLVFGSVVIALPAFNDLKTLFFSIVVCIFCAVLSYYSFKIKFKHTE